MEKYQRSITILALFCALFLIHRTVRADIAPPANTPGTNPAPGAEITQVRMVAETVLLEIQPQADGDSLARAKVSASFTMRNLGSETESMAARFPVGTYDYHPAFPEITDFKVSVDGKSIATRRIEGEDPRLGDKYTAPWQEFDVSFPPNEDVEVLITYTLEASGEYQTVYFEYFLTTGAGWKDSIGSADIIARFPYEVNPQNVLVEPSGVGFGYTTQGAVLTENEVRWHFEDFEPTRKENISFLIVPPEAWIQVLSERDNVKRNPEDGEAWGRLGKIYKEIIEARKGLRDDAAGLELYDLSVQAYENCLELLPKDALWHAGFAELLWLHGYWGPGSREELLHAAQELNLALELDPDNEQIIEILERMSWSDGFVVKNLDGTYSLLWLTATPTIVTKMPQSEEVPTSTPILASTLPDIPSTQSDPTDDVEPATPSPVCGSAAIFPLALLVLMIAKRESQ